MINKFDENKNKYYKNIIEFLNFTNTFCKEFRDELKKMDYKNKYNLLFEDNFYNFIIKDYKNINEYIKIRNLYRKNIYEYQKATFYFIISLLLNNDILKINKKYINYNNKRLNEEQILRLIYFGFFLDEINYKIYFFDKNKKRIDKLEFNGYYKYIEEYIDIFYKTILEKEIINIYNQIGFPFVNYNNKYEYVIEKYKNKKLILYTIDRDILWKFNWIDKNYPLFKYNIEKEYSKNIYNFIILSYLYYNNKKDEFIFQKDNENKNKNIKIPISIVYIWIKNNNFNENKLENIKNKNNIYKIHYNKIVKIKNIDEEILNLNSIKKDSILSKNKIKGKNKISAKKELNNNVNLVEKNINYFNIKNVDITTFAKVGSTTIWETLLQFSNKYKIEHNHNLKYLRSIIDNEKNRLIVMGIRNPLDINMSYFFMTCNGYSNTTEKILKNNYLGFHNNLAIDRSFKYEDLEKYSFEELKDMFFKKNYHFFFNQWFDELFSMIDLNKVKFDKKLGLSFYELPNNNILMFYTLEKLNDNEKILKEFFDVDKIIKENLADQKIYKKIYDEFKSKISFTKYYKDRLLHTDIMNHFYTKKEIESFYNKYPTSL